MFAGDVREGAVGEGDTALGEEIAGAVDEGLGGFGDGEGGELVALGVE